MVKKAFKAQIHKDQISYVVRVFSVGGSIKVDSQVALSRFIRYHYSVGLRDPQNINHLIMHCSVYPTVGKTGSNQNLWFINNVLTHFPGSDNFYSYTEDRGVTLLSNARIDTDVAPNVLSTNDLSIGYFCTRINEFTGYLGAVSGTFPNDLRVYSHPQFTNTRGIYFDVGLEGTRRTFGTLSNIAGDKNNKGLIICNKIGVNGKIFNKNGTRATASNLVATPSTPNVFMEHYSGGQITDRLDIGGYWYGRNIDDSFLDRLVTEWNILQTSISPSRSQTSGLSPDNFAGLEMWYDAKGSENFTLENENQITSWLDKSGNNRTLTNSISGRTAQYNPEDNGVTTLGASGQRTPLSRSDGFFLGCFAIVFQSFGNVNNTGGTNTNRCIIGTRFGTSTSAFTGLSFGSSTTILTNEVVAMLYANPARVGYTQNFAFLNRKKYLVIFNRISNTEWNIYINRNLVSTTTANTNNDMYINNQNIFLGTRWDGNQAFSGLMHEFCSFRNALSANDLNLLANYLCDVNGI